jgi:hypothetical protein
MSAFHELAVIDRVFATYQELLEPDKEDKPAEAQ